MPDRIPALLVTGTAGAGKTTFIAKCLIQRPDGERWAVLVNDFGEATLADSSGVPERAVFVREVAGCICCSAQVSLRTGIVALLREARPQRLLIEASAAAHPDAVVKILREPGIASAVAQMRTICVVDPAHAIDERYRALELYREQVQSADVVVLSKADLRSAEERRAAREVLVAIGAGRVAGEGDETTVMR
jgi:G3E family GTPase